MNPNFKKTLIQFIWGPGGVGKSHVAVRQVCQAPEGSLLITLDPSPRVFNLLGKERSKERVLCEWDEFKFYLKATDADELFQKLQEASPANEKVQYYYRELVSGLQEFRNYLALIQLAEDLSKGEHPMIIIDTPPFHEAMGLHSSIHSLKEFFEKSLVQLAVKSSILNIGVKKVLEISKIFMGQKSVQSALDFLDWLSLHIDRFKNAANSLENLTFSENTSHLMVLTPESNLSYLTNVRDFFSRTKNLSFLINRSASHFQLHEEMLPGGAELYREIHGIQKLEKNLESEIQKNFHSFKLQKLPMILMGEDTPEEMLQFIRLKDFA